MLVFDLVDVVLSEFYLVGVVLDLLGFFDDRGVVRLSGDGVIFCGLFLQDYVLVLDVFQLSVQLLDSLLVLPSLLLEDAQPEVLLSLLVSELLLQTRDLIL